MSLPNVNPGINPNQNQQNNPQGGGQPQNPTPPVSPFKQFASNAAAEIAGNVQPMNFIRQGAYNAFGNNALTRSALGLADTGLDALTKALTGQGTSDDENGDINTKLLKEQLKKMDYQTEILESIASKLGSGSMTGLIDLTETNDILMQIVNSEIKDRDILEHIAKDVIDIKSILRDGFDGLATTFADIMEKNRCPDDCETTIDKRRDQREINALVEIAASTGKMVAIMKDKPISDVEDKLEQLPPKHLGMAIEVPPTENIVKGPEPKKDDGWLAGLISAASIFIESIVSGLKKAAGLVAEKMKGLFSFIAEHIGNGIKYLKEGAESLFTKAKGIGKAVLEKGGELGKAVIEKGKLIPEKLTGVAEKVAGKSVGKQLGKTAVKGLAAGIPLIGPAITLGFAAYDGIKAGAEANEVLGIEGRDPTMKERGFAALGGAAESLSFGLIGREKAARWTQDLFSSDDSAEELKKKEQEAQNAKSVKSEQPNIAKTDVNVNNTSNSYFNVRKPVQNDDRSFSRYLDNQYTFRGF